MPQAVTHVLIPIILLSLFREYFVKNKKSFPLHYVFIGGLAGLIPDIDIGVYYVLSFWGFAFNEIHRTFSHTIYLVLIFLLLGFLTYNFKNKTLGNHHLKLSTIFFVIGFGVFIHLLLDGLFHENLFLFYPFWNYDFGLNLIRFFPRAWQETIVPVIDGILFVSWLTYMKLKNNFKDFI